MNDERALYILWTNADVETSVYMVMMYATNSMLYGWWDSVTVIIWGAPARLVAENEAVQKSLKAAKHAGVKFSACISCAKQLGVAGKLEEMDIEVKGWGQPLTDVLQKNGKLITV